MYRYTDVAWMDDRTAPSVHVRHNVEGLSTVFPPAYLLSFLIGHEGEPIQNSPDLPLYVRSRMGALGLCFKGAELSPSDTASLAAEIAIYKATRTSTAAHSMLLTAQAKATGGPTWDVMQETAAGGKQVVIFAFQSDAAASKINVKPSGLGAQTTYDIRSVDSGLLGTATGSDLTAQGIDILESPKSRAHILTLTAK
jgi:hypothetical protein